MESYSCSVLSPTKETKFRGMKSFIAYQLTPSVGSSCVFLWVTLSAELYINFIMSALSCHCAIEDQVQCIGTVANHGKNGKKKHGKFLKKSQKSRQNQGKDTASNHGSEDHYTVYKTQHLALSTIITCSARFSSVKFCRHGHIFSQ